MQILLTFYF